MNDPRELPILDLLHDNVHMLLRLEDLLHLHNVLMVDRLHDVYFFLQQLQLLLGKRTLVNLFYSRQLFRDYVLALEHVSKFALTEAASQGVHVFELYIVGS